MREVFHHELDQLADGLVDLTRLVGSAMASATQALLTADLVLAERVIAGDDRIDDIHQRLDDRAIELLALQQPVATDLRTIVAGLRIGGSLERMGDLARHVAATAKLQFPYRTVPDELVPVFTRMGSLCEELAAKAGEVIATRDLDIAAEIERDDDALDALHRGIFETVGSPDWQHPPANTVDVTLLSRFYERFGDHAVSVARRVTFLVTGHTLPPRAS